MEDYKLDEDKLQGTILKMLINIEARNIASSEVLLGYLTNNDEELAALNLEIRDRQTKYVAQIIEQLYASHGKIEISDILGKA